MDHFLQHHMVWLGEKQMIDGWWGGMLSSEFYRVSKMKWHLKENNIWQWESLIKKNHVFCMVMVEGFLGFFITYQLRQVDPSAFVANFKFVGRLSTNFGLILELRCCIFLHAAFSGYILRFTPLWCICFNVVRTLEM